MKTCTDKAHLLTSLLVAVDDVAAVAAAETNVLTGTNTLQLGNPYHCLRGWFPPNGLQRGPNVFHGLLLWSIYSLLLSLTWKRTVSW